MLTLYIHISVHICTMQQHRMGQNPVTIQAARSHSDTRHSVGLLWTSDQPDAETSTWQHTTLTRDRQPCPRRHSNPRSQQPSGRRLRGLNTHLGSTCRTGYFSNGREGFVSYSWNSSRLYCKNIPILKRLGLNNSTIEWRSHLDSNRGKPRDGTTKERSVYFTS